MEKPPYPVKINLGKNFEHDPMAIHASTAAEAVTIAQNIKALDKPMPDNVEALLKEYPALGAIANNPTLSPFKKKLLAAPILSKMKKELHGYESAAKAAVNKKESALALISGIEAGLPAYEAWMKSPFVIEKNDCSRLHKLREYLIEMHSIHAEGVKGENPNTFAWDAVKPFVVQHDWARAFATATDYSEGDFNLPFEMCAFEFRISGRTVIVLSEQSEGARPAHTFYVEFNGFWATENDNAEPNFGPFCVSQIKAICVALDAEVAGHSVTRASESLNRRRAEAGKLPLYSYHVVNLAHRSRVSNPASSVGETTKKRLHFRRGHWRHYSDFKTWVRWTLVGNPDLGFIEKEYRL